jgi:hypothetical protein
MTSKGKTQYCAIGWKLKDTLLWSMNQVHHEPLLVRPAPSPVVPRSSRAILSKISLWDLNNLRKVG